MKFCPLINDDCDEDCVFWSDSETISNHCRLNNAALNLSYLADVIVRKIDGEDEEELNDNLR